MQNKQRTFKSGVIVGVLGSCAVVGLGFAGTVGFEKYQNHQVLTHVEEQKQQFISQVNLLYLSQSTDSSEQVMQLLRQSSPIQRDVIANLEQKDGVVFQFDRLQLSAELQNHDKIPTALAGHHLYFQPQVYAGQPIKIWQCFSDLADNLRPKDCLYRQEAPDNTELLRTALLASVASNRQQRQSSNYTPPVQNDCTKFKTQLPTQYDVFATGAYSGRETSYQIDDSGHQATEMDIQVQHNRPVVLILGAYEPTIWKVKWESNTRIVGVIATGYHAQRVVGLPKAIPVLETSYKNSQCGYSYVSDDNAAEMNQLSQRILQRDIQAIVIAKNGQANIGNISADTQLSSSKERSMKDVIDQNAPLAGPAGIRDAVSKGLLRPATRADIDAWKAAYNKARNIHTPPVVGGSGSSGTGMDYVHFDSAYVVLKDMTIPAGLYGAHSVTFFVPQGVPRPKGNPGHSTIYEIRSGNCYGSSPNCSRS